MDAAVDEPVLIIKTAWGGKSLHTDFRSPSAGPYTLSSFQQENYPKQTGHGIPKDHPNADGHMTEDQKREHLKSFEAQVITPAEVAIWKRGASNAELHQSDSSEIRHHVQC